MTDKITRGRILWCMKHGHDWEPISTEGASMAMVRCTVCGAIEYRL